MIGENNIQNNTNNSSLEKKESPVQTIERIYEVDEETLSQILKIDEESFPPGWQYDDAAEYYKEMIELKENVNIVLKKDGKVIGYMLAIPMKKAYEEIHEDDQELEDDPKMMYVETISISPKERGGISFVKMFKKLFEEAGKEGKDKFSAHTRVSTGLSTVVQRLFKGMIQKVRRIESWKYYDYKEPTDYIVMKWEQK